jgi:hypothetical protein
MMMNSESLKVTEELDHHLMAEDEVQKINDVMNNRIALNSASSKGDY